MPSYDTTLIPDKIRSKFVITSECWLWAGTLSSQGYGVFHQRVGFTQYAHRIVYELLVGLIPGGLTLDHLCRIRHCVFPAHLEPVTNAENIKRGSRATRTHCIHGHLFDERNTLRWTLNRGTKTYKFRNCRICRDANEKRRPYRDRRGRIRK